ncbi:hypothetical protein BC831DRAFT_484696 [Entophlyctis helioformis]|nr:hypothetical protein BC831DRAFT_484696 [Entophlyctis helioformis]
MELLHSQAQSLQMPSMQMQPQGSPPLQSKPGFVNSFWGEQNKGLDVLLARMKQGKHLSEEVHALLRERANIEEDYGKRMSKLAKTFNPKDEHGTLREALDVVRNELERSARVHQDLANELRVKLEKPLQEFITTQSAIRKNHQRILEKHNQNRSAQESAVIKGKEKYETRSLEAAQLYQLVRQGVNSKEGDKIRAKYEKTQVLARQADQDYKASVEKLGEIHRAWQADMVTACIDYQKMEEDRFQFVRGNIWNYANFMSGLCVAEDESCERVRVSLEKCDFEKDLNMFLEKHATGSEIPKPMSYVPFGDAAIPGLSSGAPSQTPPGAISNIAAASSTGTAAPQQQRPSSILGSAFATLTGSSINSNYSNKDASNGNGGLGGGISNSSSAGGIGGFSLSLGLGSMSARSSVTQPQQQQQPSSADLNGRPSVTDMGGSSNGRGGTMTYDQPAPDMPRGISSVAYDPHAISHHHHHSHHPSAGGMGGYASQQPDVFRYDPFDVPETVNILFTVRAIYDYDANASEELTILKGQMIPVIAAHEDGWWEGLGSEDGRRRKGLFPSNFTEAIN